MIGDRVHLMATRVEDGDGMAAIDEAVDDEWSGRAGAPDYKDVHRTILDQVAARRLPAEPYGAETKHVASRRLPIPDQP